MKIEVKKGEFIEGMPFTIAFNFVVEDLENACPHTFNFGETGRVRCVIVAKNEGGYNCTAVCLDCINEALK